MNKLVAFLSLLLFSFATSIAHPSWGLVIDDDGNFYFADIMHNERGSLWKLDSNGLLTLLQRDFHAHNVNLDSNGNLIAASGEMDEHFMLRILPDGQIDTLISASDYKIFNGGNCSYTPNHEIIFQAENYFWRINSEGEKEKISEYKFKWNQSIYADKYGNYYGPEIGDGSGKIIKITPDGKAEVLAQNLITKLDRPYDKHNDVLLGIVRSPHGEIYVAELAGQRIIEIGWDGLSRTFYKSVGDWFPSAICFHSTGIYVLEYKQKGGNAGPRICKLGMNGNSDVIFDYDTYTAPKVKPDRNEPQAQPEELRKLSPWIFYSSTIAILLIALWFFGRRWVGRKKAGLNLI